MSKKDKIYEQFNALQSAIQNTYGSEEYTINAKSNTSEGKFSSSLSIVDKEGNKILSVSMMHQDAEVAKSEKKNKGKGGKKKAGRPPREDLTGGEKKDDGDDDDD